eukprot:TRINITY_DN21886_c0_g2_i1.p4 TRINITY_DN21886_c0_g2~~TRINITY_DN21886_c0_g2_i1.p4  ORF type:complete len:115 (+),score=11.41 TRINITY_DN21886_c0_g2_i1:501-845(+)
MSDFEGMSEDLTSDAIKEFVTSFATDSHMTLSFTAMGTGRGVRAPSALAAALSEPAIAEMWSCVAVQLYDWYDSSACPDMRLAGAVWSNTGSSKVLLGIPQGVNPTCTGGGPGA